MRALDAGESLSGSTAILHVPRRLTPEAVGQAMQRAAARTTRCDLRVCPAMELQTSERARAKHNTEHAHDPTPDTPRAGRHSSSGSLHPALREAIFWVLFLWHSFCLVCCFLVCAWQRFSLFALLVNTSCFLLFCAYCFLLLCASCFLLLCASRFCFLLLFPFCFEPLQP